MTGPALVDGDIVIKLARYILLRHAIDAVSQWGSGCAVLGTTRFVARSRISRQAPEATRGAALAQLARFLRFATSVEPTASETEVAGRLEDMAQSLGLSLDVGESQLVAMLAIRGYPAMFTGDKRAIAALEALCSQSAEVRLTAGRVQCLEELMSTLTCTLGSQNIGRHTGLDPDADTAMRVAFRSGMASAEEVSAALASYICDLREKCPEIMSRRRTT